MANKRIFYANHGISVAGTTVQGAQSVSVNTNFNLEQVFQLGRISIYDNIAADPTVEVTINKALDGHPPVYVLATGGGTLVGNANTQSTIKLGVGDDTSNALTNTGGRTIQMTGCYISALNYTFPVEGMFTEEITFLGSNKSLAGTVTAPGPEPLAKGTPTPVQDYMVLRRQNYSLATSVVPSYVQNKRLSQVTISADLGREAMYELGHYAPFHRFVNFPLEVTCAFDVIAATVDGVAADPSTVLDCSSAPGEAEEPICIQLCEHGGNIIHSFNLGKKCRLQSVSYSGGDTGGGNVTITYTYVTYNDLSIRNGACQAGDFQDGTEPLNPT